MQTLAAERSFKHYEIRAALGEGGYGQVFEAWDSKLCRSVALKRLHGAAAAPTESLIREARLAASVQHAAFVQVYAIEDDGDSQSIVMELVRGATLRQLLAAGPMGPDVALDILAQIAQAMHEAHRVGLVHGDLKPSNVMRDEAGKIRILDFGLASRTDATTSMAQADPQGTIAYMAPEMLSGAGSGISTDVYALGVILYELTTGARPFAALNGLALAAALVQQGAAQWEHLGQLPPALRQLVTALTARDPQQRPADMQAVLAALAALAAPPGGAAATAAVNALDGADVIAARRGPRRTLVVAGASVAVLAALLFGAWQWRDGLDGAAFPLVSVSASKEIADGLGALRLYDRPGMLAVASRHFERILASDPGNAAAVAGMSIMYSRRYQSDEQDEVWLNKAMAGAQQALQLNDQLGLAHAAHGIALERAGKREAALEAFGKSLALEPDNLFALLGEVKALTGLRRYDAARARAELGLARYPGERSFADLIGQSYFEQGNYAAAEKAYRLSLQLQPDAVFAYASLGAVLHRQGKVDEAMRILQQGLQLRPNAWLYGNLGTMLFARGDYPSAVAAFENAVSPDKGNPAAYLGWANLADALLWIPGRGGEAKQAYARARKLLAPRLARSPDDVLTVSRMGLYAAREGDRTASAELVARALRLAPDSKDVHFRAGLALELIGERRRAIEEIVLARKLGYAESSVEAEPDLAELRRDKRYPQR